VREERKGEREREHKCTQATLNISVDIFIINRILLVSAHARIYSIAVREIADNIKRAV